MRRRVSILLFGFLVGVLILNLRSPGRGGGPGVARKLESTVASDATSFDFAAADLGFAWDRVHVFGPYSSGPTVEQELGFRWPGFRRTTVERSDGVNLVVFVRNGAVAGWFEQPRSIELGTLANGNGYARAEASFTIERAGGRAELKGNPPTSTTTAVPSTTLTNPGE